MSSNRKTETRAPRKPDLREAARVALKAANYQGMPDFIRDAITDAIADAGGRLRLPTPEYNEPEAEQVRMIAELFAAAPPTFSLRAGQLQAEAPDLAELLAAVFAHPDLPDRMWDYIADGIAELDNSFDKYENPEVMREVLVRYKPRRESKRKGGAK